MLGISRPPYRRSQRGINQLATIIRDQSEQSRPWAFVSIFQSKDTFQPVLDFNLGRESWQPPEVFIDGEEVPVDFHLHENKDSPGRYTRRMVLPESRLDLDVGFADTMAVVRVHWPMPVWPVWSVLSWTADPRIMTHLRTFRQRAVEVRLQWTGPPGKRVTSPPMMVCGRAGGIRKLISLQAGSSRSAGTHRTSEPSNSSELCATGP